MLNYKPITVKVKTLDLKREELIQNPSFCTLAWTGLSVSPTGTMTPCCLFERAIEIKEGQSYRIYEDDISTAYNSDFMKNIREKMLNGEKINWCNQCYSAESHGGISMRKRANNDSDEILESYNSHDHYKPIALDLKLNNKCNLKCRMCQPKDSNLIHREFKQLSQNDSSFLNYENTRLDDPELGVSIEDIPAWENSNNFINKYKDLLPQLRKMSLVGGEPLLLDEVYDLLDIAVESGHAKNMNIVVVSNFVSVREEKLKKYFKHFRRFLILISLDAVGKQLKYIRYPTNFEKVKSNFEKLYKYQRDMKSVQFYFALTVQLYNLPYLVDVLKFVEETIHKKDMPLHDPAISFTYLKFPSHLSIDIAPDTLKKSSSIKLKKYLQVSHHCQVAPIFKRQVEQLIGRIETAYSPLRDQLLGEFLHYSETLDKSRGDRMKDYLPELYDCLVSEGIIATQPKPNIHRLREIGWELISEKDIVKAIKVFEQTKELPSNNTYLDFRELGWMYFNTKQYSKSYESYKRAFELNKEDKNILKGLYYVSKEVGDIELAQELLPLAKRFNPEDISLQDQKL
jgi:MoaA/NifB/PqqE/SkfB family radical SAM enzyme